MFQSPLNLNFREADAGGGPPLSLGMRGIADTHLVALGERLVLAASECLQQDILKPEPHSCSAAQAHEMLHLYNPAGQRTFLIGCCDGEPSARCRSVKHSLI